MIIYKTSKSLIEPGGHFRQPDKTLSLSLLDTISKLDAYPSYLSLSISSSSASSLSEPIKKPKKWKNVTKDLASFTVKRFENNFYFVNEPSDPVSDMDSNEDYPHDYQQKPKKRLSTKKLIKSNQLKSIKSPQIILNSNKNCKYLHIKHNLYKSKLIDEYFNLYVVKLQRARHLYSIRRIDSRAKDKEFLIENKKYFKSLKLIERLIDSDRKVIDPPILNHFTIDHNRVNQEFEQNYDQMYVEFLISLQHRDITPEDYEYLSRLDELIKKKTINDKLLDRLRTEVVDDEFNRLGELCGICMDEYEIGQMCKHLPCGHVFHSDCIDNWLKKHSTTCPLDNLSIEETIEKNVKINENECKLDDVCSIEFEVECVLNDIIDKIV